MVFTTFTNTLFSSKPNTQTSEIMQCITRTYTPNTNMNTNTNKLNKNTMLMFMKTPRNTKNSRHNSKNILHKKMRVNLQYKAVINLSDENISNSTLTALSKGLCVFQHRVYLIYFKFFLNLE
jgi:hypothetical protein